LYELQTWKATRRRKWSGKRDLIPSPRLYGHRQHIERNFTQTRADGHLVGITSGSTLAGCTDIRSERLFALTGNKNFAMMKVRQLDTDHDEVTVDLCWPGGEEGEVTRKSIVLK
jgi:hypothetical protein